ncbi:Oidioi.mRNA.OKI2018_I69.chr1.g1595.t1.cds [Oikopleura dioica]|uniref:Oidioi.mRNA.OKI2018_I69.chr1.g1595.t1.cds n=1 Tax=Oikopleura dioica TaxID=34765 RepID=A0ABN7SNE7_OIKDI|nr:Oidioi.mRNA.OKI2018_I69.chr1.g1595.t1.cds [Oikopleura dioica]
MTKRRTPIARVPVMAKQVLDLFSLYTLVVERGGLVEVIQRKIWREITKGLKLPNSITSAAFTLRTQYMKYLYPFECHKENLSSFEDLQNAIDGNKRDNRRNNDRSLEPLINPFQSQIIPHVLRLHQPFSSLYRPIPSFQNGKRSLPWTSEIPLTCEKKVKVTVEFEGTVYSGVLQQK